MDPAQLDKTSAITSRRPLLDVVIETTAGSRNKFTYDEGVGAFRLHKILPVGFEFPFDFGFVPGTLAEDGDPLDVLIIGDEPTFTGCIMCCEAVVVLFALRVPDVAQLKERGQKLSRGASLYERRFLNGS